MKAKVTPLARVNDGTGTFPWVPVKIARRRIVLPVERRRDGQIFTSKDILGFYARYSQDGKRRIETLGKDPVGAYTRFLQVEQDFQRVKTGLLPINSPEPESEPTEDRSLRTCAKTFTFNQITQGKKKATIYAYTKAVDALAAQFPEKIIDKVTEQDMLDHIALLRTKIKKRINGDGKHTFRNRLRNLTVFFNDFGVKNPLAMRKLAKPTRKRPYRYSVELVNQMLDSATLDEQDLIHFFLKSGFRDEETAYSTYSDIDFEKGSLNVYPKPQYGWTPKDSDYRQEDILLHDDFVERMKARKERNSRKDSDLIFPQQSQDKPDMHLIRRVKNVATRAGITKPVDLHAFRRTFGSIVAKEYGIEKAKVWLGHSDIETTQAYIASEELSTEASRQKVSAMFAGFRK